MQNESVYAQLHIAYNNITYCYSTLLNIQTTTGSKYSLQWGKRTSTSVVLVGNSGGNPSGTGEVPFQFSCLV